MSTNIDTTEGLDEAYYQYLGGKPDDDEMESWEEFKQAIFDWVNEVVVSQERPYEKLEKCPVCSNYQYSCACDSAEDMLMEKQRTILREHGWKESK
jgi:hypothetical protein